MQRSLLHLKLDLFSINMHWVKNACNVLDLHLSNTMTLNGACWKLLVLATNKLMLLTIMYAAPECWKELLTWKKNICPFLTVPTNVERKASGIFMPMEIGRASCRERV